MTKDDILVYVLQIIGFDLWFKFLQSCVMSILMVFVQTFETFELVLGLFFETLMGAMEKSFAYIFGDNNMSYSTFHLIWLFCCLLLIFMFSKEMFVTKIIGGKSDDQNILRKILLSIETNNTIETLQLLHKYPEYVNCPAGEPQYTPFLLACYHGNTEVVKFMLQINADSKSKTKRGESPFYLAVAHLINNPFSIDASCIRELYYAGCDVNEPNIHGYTPLHLAANFGHKALIQWLLGKGANRNVFPSPAEMAVSKGHLQAASVILNWENKRRMITSE